MTGKEQNLLIALNKMQKLLKHGEQKISADKKPTMLFAEKYFLDDCLKILVQDAVMKKV